jgi:hypothetical protein
MKTVKEIEIECDGIVGSLFVKGTSVAFTWECLQNLNDETTSNGVITEVHGFEVSITWDATMKDHTEELLACLEACAFELI